MNTAAQHHVYIANIIRTKWTTVLTSSMRIYICMVWMVAEGVERLPQQQNWKKCRSNKINWFRRVELQQSNSRFERERADPRSFSATNYFGTLLYSADIAFVILSRDKRSCLTRNYRAKVYRRTAHGLFRRNITCGPKCDVRILRKSCWKWKYRENSGYTIKPARNVFFSIT